MEQNHYYKYIKAVLSAIRTERGKMTRQEEIELEMMYFKQELKDIKNFCIKHNQMIIYRNRPYYLYNKHIYDENMDIVIREAENGFLDLFEYFEYFEKQSQ